MMPRNLLYIVVIFIAIIISGTSKVNFARADRKPKFILDIVSEPNNAIKITIYGPGPEEKYFDKIISSHDGKIKIIEIGKEKVIINSEYARYHIYDDGSHKVQFK